jgi:hypothetical protein
MSMRDANAFETLADESTYGETPFAEAFEPGGEAFEPGGGEAFEPGSEAFEPSGETFEPGGEAFEPSGEAFEPGGEAFEPSGEAEWESPFAAAEGEGANALEHGQEYGQEAYAPDGSEAESPLAGEGFTDEAEAEIMRGPNEFPDSCGDVTFDGKPWKFGRVNPANVGRVSSLTFVPRAEVFEFQLLQFDVDRHELKRQHHDAIADFTKRVLASTRAGRYTGEPIKVFTYGEASSTAPSGHNNPLSRNRAFNALNAIRCAFKNAGVSHPVSYGLYGTGEQHARVRGPDQKEDPQFRGVMVRAFAPLKDCQKCGQVRPPYRPSYRPPPPRRPQPPRPGPTPPVGTTAICVSVPRILPRNATTRPPDVIPLAPLIPGLRLPVAIVTRAQAMVRVDDRRSRQSGQFTFKGWGLEFALPPGRTRIDLRAEVRACLQLLVTASASLGARLQLGPLKLSLRIDVSAFAKLIVKLCAQLRLRLDVDLGRPNVPELSQCRYLDARNVRGPGFPFAALAGPAVLIVPGVGYGPAVLTLGSPAVPGLGLRSNVLQVPADKSTIRTLLALGGSLQLAPGGVRLEAEHEAVQGEWPEAFEEVHSELAPFV